MTNQETITELQCRLDEHKKIISKYGEKIPSVVRTYQKEIDLCKLAIAALEKQEPVQIRKFGDGTSKCPICRNWLKEDMDFCDKCGQAISWRADDEPYR